MEQQPMDDRRGKPRYHLRSGAVWVRVEPQFKVLDVSATGVAFLADMPFPIDEKVHLVLNRAILIEARVVDCRLIETDARLLEAKYSVHCHYLDASHGSQLMDTLDALGDLTVEATTV